MKLKLYPRAWSLSFKTLRYGHLDNTADSLVLDAWQKGPYISL